MSGTVARVAMRAGLAALAVGAGAGETPGDPGSTNLAAAVQVVFTNGARMSGRLCETGLAYVCSFGRILVPWTSVSEISRASVPGVWVLKMGGRTTLRGAPEAGAMGFSNAFGRRSVPYDLIGRIRVALTEPAVANSAAPSGRQVRRQTMLDLTDGTRLICSEEIAEARLVTAEAGTLSLRWAAIEGITNDMAAGRTSVRFASGDLLVGEWADEEIALESTVGPIRVPWKRIRQVSFQAPPDGALPAPRR